MDKVAFEIELSKRIAKIEADILDLQKNTKPISPDDAIGRVSRMDAINNKSVVEASLRNLERKLKGLKIAQQNTDNPNFGQCAKCKRPIPEARILLMPESRFCVSCSCG